MFTSFHKGQRCGSAEEQHQGAVEHWDVSSEPIWWHKVQIRAIWFKETISDHFSNLVWYTYSKTWPILSLNVKYTAALHSSADLKKEQQLPSSHRHTVTFFLQHYCYSGRTHQLSKQGGMGDSSPSPHTPWSCFCFRFEITETRQQLQPLNPSVSLSSTAPSPSAQLHWVLRASTSQKHPGCWRMDAKLSGCGAHRSILAVPNLQGASHILNNRRQTKKH